jgi:hypothetical protein
VTDSEVKSNFGDVIKVVLIDYYPPAYYFVTKRRYASAHKKTLSGHERA